MKLVCLLQHTQRPPPRSENVDGGLQPKTRLEYFLNKIAENGGSGSGGDSGLVLKLTGENSYSSSIGDFTNIMVRSPGVAGFIDLTSILVKANPDIKTVIGINVNSLPIALLGSNNGIDIPMLLDYSQQAPEELAPVEPDPSIDPSNRKPAYTFKDTAYALRVTISNMPFYLITPFEVVETYVADKEIIA